MTRLFHPEATLSYVNKPRRLDTVDALDPYVERFYTPILGPASVALIRWAAREHADQFPLVDVPPLIGLGPSTGQWAPIWKVINRLASFGLLDHDNTRSHLVVWSMMRPLNKTRLAKLPMSLQDQERRWWEDRRVA